MSIKVWLYVWLQDCFKCRKLAHFLSVEVCWLIKNKTIAVAKNVGREPTIQTKATSTDNRSKTTLYKSLASLEVLTCDRHHGLFCQFPHSRNINSCVWSTHDERSPLNQSCISITHGRSNVLTVVSLHSLFKSCQCAVYLLVLRNVDFGRCCPNHNNTSTTVLLLEVANILTQSLNHFPTSLAVLDIITCQTLGIVLIKRSLHWNNLLQFVLNRIDILFLQYLAVHC